MESILKNQKMLVKLSTTGAEAIEIRRLDLYTAPMTCNTD